MEQSFLPIWMPTAEIAVIVSIITIVILTVMHIVNKRNDLNRAYVWYVYDKQRNRVLAGPCIKKRAKLVLKTYTDKKRFKVVMSKDGPYTNHRIDTDLKDKSKGIDSFMNTDISRLKAIKIIAKVLIASYKETVKDYWRVIYNTAKGIFELMIMSILVIMCTMLVTFLFLIAAFISLISKTLRNEIKSDYLEESGCESNKSEGEIAKKYLFGDEEF